MTAHVAPCRFFSSRSLVFEKSWAQAKEFEFLIEVMVAIVKLKKNGRKNLKLF